MWRLRFFSRGTLGALRLLARRQQVRCFGMPRLHWIFLFVFFSLVPLIQSFSSDNAAGSKNPVENFTLSDQESQSRELYHQNGALAVVLIFTTTGCPIVQKSVPKIKALRNEFASQGVIFWLINSTPQDDTD